MRNTVERIVAEVLRTIDVTAVCDHICIAIVIDRETEVVNTVHEIANGTWASRLVKLSIRSNGTSGVKQLKHLQTRVISLPALDCRTQCQTTNSSGRRIRSASYIVNAIDYIYG